MEQAIFLFAWKRFSIKGIYEARKSKLSKVVLQAIFTGMMLSSPIILELQKKSLVDNYVESNLIGTVYISLIVLNVIFLLGLSVMALAINMTAADPFSLKEIFAFLSYTATIPAVVSMVAGMFGNVSFVYFVYNFGILFFAYFVYKKGQLRACME